MRATNVMNQGVMGGSFSLKNVSNNGSERVGQIRSFKDSSVKMGRMSTCQVVIDSVYTTVSRVHAEIKNESGKWFIVHLSSTNPTLINGRQVNVKQELRNGDVIKLAMDGPEFQFVSITESRNQGSAHNETHQEQGTHIDQKNTILQVGQKKCQFCFEIIKQDAMVCKHCGREQLAEQQINKMAVVIATRYWFLALIAGYLLALIMPWMFFVGIIGSMGIMYYYKSVILKSWTTLDIYNVSKKIKESRRKTIRNVVISIFALVVIAAVSNPDESKLKANLKAKRNYTYYDIVNSQSMVVMSFYEVKVLDFGGTRTELYLGVFGQFYLVESE
jgi:pSer/pThr/pTyr-binding forkhead associated (FHA) protein